MEEGNGLDKVLEVLEERLDASRRDLFSGVAALADELRELVGPPFLCLV